MDSDTLLAIERWHLLRLGAWGAVGMVVGGLCLLVIVVRRVRVPLLYHFTLQATLWGAVHVGAAALGLRALAPRDYTAATQLVRALWLNVALATAFLLLGATIALVAVRLGRRQGAIGAGLGLVVQGVALLVLDAIVLTQVGPAL